MRFFRDQTRRCRFVEGNTAQYHRPTDYCTALEYEHSDLTPQVFNEMSFTENFGRQPRALIVAEMAAELLVIAALDFVTQRHVLPACLYLGGKHYRLHYDDLKKAIAKAEAKVAQLSRGWA